MFSVKGQTVTLSSSVGHVVVSGSLLQTLSSAVVAQKQPWGTHKTVVVAASGLLQAIVCSLCHFVFCILVLNLLGLSTIASLCYLRFRFGCM